MALPGSHYPRRGMPWAGACSGGRRLAVSPHQLAPGAGSPGVRPLRHEATLSGVWGEKKASKQSDGAFLDWALESFSGYVAADELYEGPSWVLSVGDHRQYTRILYKVLAHDPTPDDIMACVERLKRALTNRD